MSARVDLRTLRKAVAEAERINDLLEGFEGLFKTDGNRLKEAGKAVIRQAKKDGMTQTRVAELLGITPAAVNYHWN